MDKFTIAGGKHGKTTIYHKRTYDNFQFGVRGPVGDPRRYKKYAVGI